MLLISARVSSAEMHDCQYTTKITEPGQQKLQKFMDDLCLFC